MKEDQPSPSGNVDQPVNESKTSSNTAEVAPTAPVTPETVAPEPTLSPEPVASNPPSTTPASSASITTNAAPSTQSKKSHKGLIAGIITALLLLGGGGAFAALAIVKNQPENIALESFGNLLNAKQLAVTGEINITPSGDLESQMGPVSIKINSETSGANQSLNTGFTVNYTGIDQPINLDFGEVMMSDGVFYIKASGLKKIYDDILYDVVKDYLTSSIENAYSYNSRSNCYSISDLNAYLDCVEKSSTITDAATLVTIRYQVATIQSHIENIIGKVDDKWFEFSIPDILEDELVKSYIDSSTKSTITKAYNCFVETANKSSEYSSELSDLYSNNQFITLQSAEDSFYKLSVDNNKFASYLNAVPKTKLVNDFASCNGETITDEMITPVTADQVSEAISEFPDVYAKFDGFLNHHLTALKISKNTDYFNLSAGLNFTYPGNLTVTAPTDSTPVMEVVKSIMGEIEAISSELGN